jgi:hypothetical protein
MAIGARLPRSRTPEHLRDIARTLGRRGTCLTRALAVAARAEKAEVVIAVLRSPNAPLTAHAWVEVDGLPIEPSEVIGLEIARLICEE